MRGVESSERTVIEQLVDRLQVSYPNLSPDMVTTVVQHHHARFDGRPVRDFVPLFVERRSRQELATVNV
jgi:hypothetical protein